MFWDAVTALGTLAAAVSAAIAAGASWKSATAASQSAAAAGQAVTATRDATSAQLLLMLLSEYATASMKCSLETLKAFWQRQTKGERFDPSTDSLSADEVHKIDEARRTVHWFYKKAWVLKRRGLIAKEDFREIQSTSGYVIFHHIAIPLSVRKDLIGGRPAGATDWIDQMKQEFPVPDITIQTLFDVSSR
ncbi:MAG: hypothetical protein L0210_10040 [Rhodospirillales bacterium]|nr:hypothetical protein [Rhodospirillales bacterium]